MINSSYSVYNLLVHYGPKGERNFIDLLEDNVLEGIIDNPDIRVKKKDYFVEDLAIYSGDGNYYLRGKFTKQFDFKSARHKEQGQRRNQNLLIEALPYAYFILDLVNHRLIWIKPKAITAAPNPSSFCTFLKEKIVNTLQPLALYEAISLWDSDLELREGNTKRKFVSNYLQEAGVTKKHVSTKVIPLIDNDTIEEIIRDEQFAVKKISLAVSRPNATNREIDDARSGFDSVARFSNDKLGVDPKVIIEKSGGVIENKEEVVDFVKRINETGNLELMIDMQNVTNKSLIKKVGVNIGDDEQETDVKFRKEDERLPEEILPDVTNEIKDIVPSYELSEYEKNENSDKVESWLQRIRVVFTAFPFL